MKKISRTIKKISGFKTIGNAGSGSEYNKYGSSTLIKTKEIAGSEKSIQNNNKIQHQRPNSQSLTGGI
jgi:hypothetical protein